MSYMGERLRWSVDARRYVMSRSERYDGGQDIDPLWCQEALDDPCLAALEPDPKSRMRASRFIGMSTTLRKVVTVIAYRDLDGDLHLINAWIATGADRALYEEADDGTDDRP